MSLKIKNLFKKYDENWIIKDVSLEVAKGEILAVYGIVGVGKSTLLRSIAGVEDKDDGLIFFDSQDYSNVPCDERKKIHFPKVTNEAFWTSVFETPKSSQLADGEGQTLALENALKEATDVLLLDNQFCFMDKITRERNCEKLRETVKEKNLAVVFATNDYDEVFSISDRVAVLHDGEILQTGTPREVYEKPETAVVARVTGRNNLIEAKISNTGSGEMHEFKTVQGEHLLFTDRADKNALDSTDKTVTLAIRPEHVSISFGASFPEDNLLKAKITNIIFRGAATLIKLDADGLKLEALVLRLVGLNVGDECMVGLPPNRIQIVKN